MELSHPIVCLLGLFLMKDMLNCSLIRSLDESMAAILVSQSHKLCRLSDPHFEIPVCEIEDSRDQQVIESFMRTSCYSPPSCTVGDRAVCHPLMTVNTLDYQCFCRSQYITVDTASFWTDWEFLSKNERRSRQFRYRRQLLAGEGNDCISEEYKLDVIQYLVSDNNLPDSVYDGASYTALHAPHRARIDNYFDYSCGWSGHPYNDLIITLPESELYYVSGVLIKQRCDHLQWPTLVQVAASDDGQTWFIVMTTDISDAYSSYDGLGSVSIWLDRAYVNNFWKITILESHKHPAMKCDLIGYRMR